MDAPHFQPIIERQCIQYPKRQPTQKMKLVRPISQFGTLTLPWNQSACYFVESTQVVCKLWSLRCANSGRILEISFPHNIRNPLT